MTDIELGREALRHFHNASIKYSVYEPENLDELVELYGKKRDIYLDGVGMVIRENGMSQHAVETAMKNLAAKAQGKIPRDHQGYVYALGNKAGQISYLDLSATVAVDVATAAAKGAQQVGGSVLTTLSWLTALLPYLAVGGVIFYILSFGDVKTVANKVITKVKRKTKKATA